MNDLTPFSDCLRNVAMGTNFMGKIGEIGLLSFISSHWHSDKDWNIVIPIEEF